MTVFSQHLMSDYDRMFYSAQADRIIMMKMMYEERKKYPELELPDLQYDFNDYASSDASNYTFKICLNNLLKINADIAVEIECTPELEEKYKQREYLYMVIKWPLLDVLTERADQIRDVILETFNESTEWESIAAEWDINDRNILLIDSMTSVDFSSCLKNLFPLFTLLRKALQEG